MDLPIVESFIEKNQAKTKQLEEELKELFTQAYGKGNTQGELNFLKNIADRDFPKVNPLTGEKVPVNLREEIIRKSRIYFDKKITLNHLIIRKTQLGGYTENYLPEEEFVKRICQEFGIKPNAVNPETITSLKQLIGKPKIEIIEGTVDAMLKELGLPAGLIKVEKFPNKIAKMFMGHMGFNSTECKLLYVKEIIEQVPDTYLIALTAHEMQHCSDFINLAQTVGLNNLKNILCKMAKEDIKMNFAEWKKVLKRVPKTNKDTKAIEYSVQNYNTMTGNYSDNILYYSNTMERRAYQRMYDIEHGLLCDNPNSQIIVNSTFDAINSTFATKILSYVNKLKKIKGKSFDTKKYIDELQVRSLVRCADINTSYDRSQMSIQELMIKIIQEDIMAAKKAL